MRATLVLIVLLGGCEDTRRASDRRRDDDDRVRDKLDHVQTKLDDLQARISPPPVAVPTVPATVSSGAYECDELIRLVRCSFDKAGAAIPPEALKAFEDGAAAWKDALANSYTRQSTIDACKMSLDAGRSGFDAQGCY